MKYKSVIPMPNKKKKPGKSTAHQSEVIRKAADIKLPTIECKQCLDHLSINFTGNEQKEAKQLLRLKDLAHVPLLIVAAVVGKADIVIKLLKDGLDINEIDKNNVSALQWALKLKKLDMIECLISNGAFVQMKANDHILFTALENKLWDEQSFLQLWNLIKNQHRIDINLVNRNGLSMLHLAVRREWMNFIEILILDKADVNIINENGVTPLMLASYRSNLQIVKHLLNSGANLVQPDNHGYIALCYSFCSAIDKKAKPPFVVVDRILFELDKAKVSIHDYLKERINMIGDPYIYNSVDKTQPNPEQLLANIIIFVIIYVNDGTKLLFVEYKFLHFLANLTNDHIDHPQNLRTILIVLHSILKYFFVEREDLRKLIATQYVASKFLQSCIGVMKRYTKIKADFHLVNLAMSSIVKCVTIHGNGTVWLDSNHSEISKMYSEISKSIQPENMASSFDVSAETLEIFERKIHGGQQTAAKSSLDQEKQLDTNCDKTDAKKGNSKKLKRRSKALKAKIAKIKSAELTIRYKDMQIAGSKSNTSLNGSLSKRDSQLELTELYIRSPSADKCEIVNSIKTNMNIKDGATYENAESLHEACAAFNKVDDNTNDWTNQIKELKFRSNPTTFDVYKNGHAYGSNRLRNLFTNIFESQHSGGKELIPVFRYLADLLQRIIKQYHKYWTIDKEIEHEAYRYKSPETNTNSNANAEVMQNHILHVLEKEKLVVLEEEFQGLIQMLEEQADTNLKETYTVLKQLEKLLLTHEIRGTSILQDVLPMENIILNVIMPQTFFIPGLDESESTLAKYVEEVLNDERDELPNIKIRVISTGNESCEDSLIEDFLNLNSSYRKPRSKSPTKSSKNITHPYHLVPSILSNCCDDEDAFSTSFLEEARNIFMTGSDSDENCETLNPTNDTDECTCKCTANTFYSYKPTTTDSSEKTVLLDPPEELSTVDDDDDDSLMKSRWRKLMKKLELMDNCQIFFDGKIRISNQEKRQSHVISTGGNFTPVELGLSRENNALAVKRVPKGSCVCKMIKNMVDPLLHLEHRNLLPYYFCEFSDSELILATPLSEYNVGQYVMLMKNSSAINAISPNKMVRQFLTGLQYLHQLKESVVHGNLKPSNIFVDLDGTVKIAEFGIHKALFKFKEAASSSIIWFSTETFRTFRELSIMECNLASDIQVAGMLIYFIMMAGQHPFGHEMRLILKNLEKATPKLATHDMELQDLIAWMLLSEPSDRPSIKQVLAHVFFWSTKRKWRFILACSGITQTYSTNSIHLEDLHHCLDKISVKENVKGNWVSIMNNTFTMDAMVNDDTPTGLLRFINTKVSNGDLANIEELKKQIFTAFPAFALSLYRMIESTPWIDHQVFQGFYSLPNS